MSEIKFGDVEQAALDYAAQAGLTQPATLGPTVIDPDEMRLEVSVLEARLSALENVVENMTRSLRVVVRALEVLAGPG